MRVYLISDCHGNIEGLERALFKAKITNKHGNRQLERRHQVIQIGDLANCVRDSVQGDLACLELVGSVIDSMLIGNHEIPYFDPQNTFWGYSHYEQIDEKLHELYSNNFLGAASLFDKTLITHAGFSRHFLIGNISVKKVFEKIEEDWNSGNFRHSWFSSVGHARGGRSPAGGIVWCDFHEELMPCAFPQIVGHTVRPNQVRMKDNVLCIDVGSKDPEIEPFILELI